MKSILLTVLIFLSLTPALNAQRSADLRFRVDYPWDTAHIQLNKQYPFKATIFNDGPDTVKFSDTTAMYFIIDGDTALTFAGIIRKYRVLNVLILPGDSMVIDEPGVFPGSTPGSFNYCIFIKPINYSDPINDNHLANNKSCSFIVLGNKSGIQSTGKNQDFTVYPNPVTNTFSITGVDEILSYRMTNVEGREVDIKSTGFGEFDCSNIQTSGMYLLSVTTRQGTSALKVMVSR